MDEAKAFLRRFVELTQPEPGCLYYDFSVRGDVVFCREAYVGAEGLLKHVEQVGGLLGDFLKIAEVARLEVHGSPEELDKLRGPLGGMNPEWYVFEVGAVR